MFTFEARLTWKSANRLKKRILYQRSPATFGIWQQHIKKRSICLSRFVRESHFNQ